MATPPARIEPGPAPAPPPAPPLPPLRYGHRAASAIARLAQPFLYPSRPASAQGHGEHASRPAVLVPSVPRSSSPVSSKTTVHKTGIPIAAFDINREGSHAVLAGRDILKTVRVHGAACTEDFNLRSAVVAYAATHHASRDAVSAAHRDQLAANDVKWSHGKYRSVVATAAANGRIVLYDLNRTGVELARLHEHTRQVHKLAFNQFQGYYLLSGSQDATVRIWDMRTLAGERSVMSCRSTSRYSGSHEGIRDLRWSTTDAVEFATATDNGVIQRWDIRKATAPLLTLNAHDKTCHSIDWHPSGKYLASGGADGKIKIWNFKSSDRRMKPYLEIRAPQAVLNVRWRPLDDGSDDNPESRHTTYLASSYDQHDPRIHIWDIRRPFTPFQELDRYDTSPSDILWHSQNLLWSVGGAGWFTQTDLNFAPRPMDRRNVNVVTTAPNGRICFFSDAKPRKAAAANLHDAEDHFLRRANTNGSSGEKLSSGQTTAEGSLEEPGMLSNVLRKRRVKQANARFAASTPPVTPKVPEFRLEDVLKDDGSYQTGQTAAIGRILGVFDASGFQLLAKSYVEPMPRADMTESSHPHETLKQIFDQNAVLASHTGQYRLAQTWKILGAATYGELESRASAAAHLRRTGRPTAVLDKPEDQDANAESGPKSNQRDFQPLQATKPMVLHLESSSNMPTPLARPAGGLSTVPPEATDLLDAHHHSASPPRVATSWADHSSGSGGDSTMLPANGQKDSNRPASLPDDPSPTGDGAHYKEVGGVEIIPPMFGGFPDLDRQMDERRAALNDYRPRPRTFFTLDGSDGISQSLTVAPRLDRHDSNDSFQMFSASSDSDRRSMPMSASFDSHRTRNRGNSFPDQWGSAPAGDSEDSPAAFELESYIDPPPIRETRKMAETQVLETVGDVQHGTDIHSQSRDLVRPISPFVPIVYIRGSERSKEATERDHLDLGCHEPEEAKAEAPESDAFLRPSDFSPSRSPPDHPPPWSASALIPPILDFHLNMLSDAQLPTFLILYLNPFFPHLFDPDLTDAILLSYHQQLASLCLFVEAAALRNVCHPHYPALGAQVMPQQAIVLCPTCRKPPTGDVPGFCTRCRTVWRHCPICELPDSPFRFDHPGGGQIISNFWLSCTGCSHVGHEACLDAWFRDEENRGTCAYPGCGHDCMPGPRRRELEAEAEAERIRAKQKGGNVARDAWVAGESRAVERARIMVAEGVARGADAGAGAGAGAGGRTGGGRGADGRAVRGARKSVDRPGPGPGPGGQKVRPAPAGAKTAPAEKPAPPAGHGEEDLSRSMP